MFKSLLIAFLLLLVFLNEAKLQRPLHKESPNGRTAFFLRELLRQGHQEKSMREMKVKWREIFNTDDLNKDGVITLAERDRRIQIFIDIYTTYLEKTLRKSFYRGYFSFGGNESAIAIDQFVDGMENAYKNDSSKLVEKIRTCNKLSVPFIDVNGDTRISWQEYKNFVSRAFVIETDALKADFISWNSKFFAYKAEDAKDKYSIIEITWAQFKKISSQNSEIATDELELQDDFLRLNPHVSVEKVIDDWAAFAANDRGTYNQVQKEMANSLFF